MESRIFGFVSFCICLTRSKNSSASDALVLIGFLQAPQLIVGIIPTCFFLSIQSFHFKNNQHHYLCNSSYLRRNIIVVAHGWSRVWGLVWLISVDFTFDTETRVQLSSFSSTVSSHFFTLRLVLQLNLLSCNVFENMTTSCSLLFNNSIQAILSSFFVCTVILKRQISSESDFL